MSRVVVPIHLGNLAAIPTGTDIGFKQLYLRTDWVKLYNGVSEEDLVLDRPLDNFTPITGSITAADTVLTALEKLQYSISLLANSVSEAPNDGSQYVRKNEAWNKLTTYATSDPSITDNVSAGYPLGNDWFNTNTGEKFYQKANGIWVSYNSNTPGGDDSPVMFADYATTTDLIIPYDNGIGGVGATLTSPINGTLFIDGFTVQLGETVLVKDQPVFIPIEETNISYQNGVYVLTQAGGPGEPFILTRADFADESAELFPSQVNVLKGLTNKDRFFLQKTENPVIGVSDIIYEINYVPPVQVILLPVIHVDTATSDPLPECVQETLYLTGTVNGNLGVINGVDMTIALTSIANRKILVKNQVNASQNGDYDVVQIGSISQPWKLRRITNSSGGFNKNNREWKVNNEDSILYGNRYYMNNVSYIFIVGTTDITFSELTPGEIQSLQDVTDVGNTTDNDIQFGTGAGVYMNNGSRLKEGTIDAGYGGSKGIAQICAVGYELKWEAGRLYVMGDGGTTIREVSHNFTTTPTIYDDITKGFIVGSRWLLDDGTLYLCTDNTDDTAVWELQVAGNQSLQDVIDVNKVADRVEFTFTPFQGKAFTGGYDYLIEFMESNQDDGVYIYGDFAQYGTSIGQDIVKINSNGTIDTSFNVGTGFNNYPYNGSGKLAQTAAGKLYATGSFTTYNGITVNRIVRLNTDGTIDSSFVSGSGFYGGLDYTNSIGLDSLERVYVAGGCLNYNGTSIPTFARLLSDGTLDSTFVMGSGFDNTTTTILVNSDDTLFVGGHFGIYKGVSSPRLVKLLSNGDIDTSFVIGAGFNNIVTGIVKTLDNKILVTGLFTTYQGVAASKIIKLNLDGSRDTSFVVGTGFTTEPYMVKVMQDGNYLITATGTYRGITSTGFLIVNSIGFPTLSPALSGYSYTGSTQLTDGRIIGMSNTGATDNYLVQIVNGLPIKDQKLTFSEVTGKAEYTIDTLVGTTTYELLPKHLIQNLITESIPVVPTPTLQEVTYAGNTTTDVISSALGFETTLLGISTNQMAFMGVTSINSGGGIITYKGLLSLQAGSLDGTGFMSNLTSDNLTQDRFLKLPNKNGTLAITTDIPAAQVNSNWNATSGVAQILNKPLIPIVDSVPTYGSPNAAMSGGVFDALALKADLVAGKVPSSQLPSYVDDVVEVANFAALPVTGETGKIYVTLDTGFIYRWTGSVYVQIATGGSVTSVGLTMPSAFTVTNSPITTTGDIAVTGAGVASQYVRGDGSLANFPTSTGGGASVSYYLNGSISQGTIGGVAYKEMNGTPVIGTGTDFTINTDGYIAQFITDVGDPNKLSIPAGNWNFETYFSASSGGGSPQFYIELYKYDGATFTLIASNSATPENITGGTAIDLYFTALAVPPTVLLATDRLAVRFYVIPSGRTITMHTENSHLSQIITTFSTGLTALNGLTNQVQYFATGTTGTDFSISSLTDTHTFNLPTASATKRGALSSADWLTFFDKQEELISGVNIRTVNGFNLLSSGNISVGTVTSVAALTLGTTGTDLSSTVATGTTTPVITLNVPTASATNRGVLSSANWSTFNGKQDALSSGVNIKTINGNSVLGSGDIVISGSGVPMTRQEFTFTSSQSFTLSGTPSYIYGVFVQGQELDSDQYSSSGTTLTILNTLGASDSVNILYTPTTAGILEYYTKAQVDALIANVTPDINIINATKITLMYNT